MVSCNQPTHTNPPFPPRATGSWILNTPAERVANAPPLDGVMETKSRVQWKSSSVRFGQLLLKNREIQLSVDQP